MTDKEANRLIEEHLNPKKVCYNPQGFHSGGILGKKGNEYIINKPGGDDIFLNSFDEHMIKTIRNRYSEYLKEFDELQEIFDEYRKPSLIKRFRIWLSNLIYPYE